jgi:hypothetical protein
LDACLLWKSRMVCKYRLAVNLLFLFGILKFRCSIDIAWYCWYRINNGNGSRC